MKRLSLLLAMTKVGLALVFLIGAGVSNTAQAQSYKIKAGDSLQIEVLEDPSLSRSVLVLPDGQFSFPFVGEVRA
ncbi:MAG: polysaccharide biosynthesis/export family protein, partial [Pseudomonadota bacterium]|nr:polysaccharide biosynthesis/export family protein [Pseudomonadota bacterium]